MSPKGKDVPFWLKMAAAIAGAIVAVAAALGTIGGPLLSLMGGKTVLAADREHSVLHKRITRECDASDILNHVDKRFDAVEDILRRRR